MDDKFSDRYSAQCFLVRNWCVHRIRDPIMVDGRYLWMTRAEPSNETDLWCLGLAKKYGSSSQSSAYIHPALYFGP